MDTVAEAWINCKFQEGTTSDQKPTTTVDGKSYFHQMKTLGRQFIPWFSSAFIQDGAGFHNHPSHELPGLDFQSEEALA